MAKLTYEKAKNKLRYQILVSAIHKKYLKNHIKAINQKQYQLQHGMVNVNYSMDHILYQILKIVLNIL